MLFAAEGGGFFSSSAAGYSTGLTLLLLGQKHQERHMRVSPWNQYQLVEQDLDPDIQLASSKDKGSHICMPLICFGRVSSGLDGNSAPKVGPAHQTDITVLSPADKENVPPKTDVEDENAAKVYLKSSLKKNPTACALEDLGDPVAKLSFGEDKGEIPVCTEKRKVQWIDACGRELVEVKEFEPRRGGNQGFAGPIHKTE